MSDSEGFNQFVSQYFSGRRPPDDELRARINEATAVRSTLLQAAAQRHSPAFVERLIVKYGADPNAKSYYGTTTMCFALSNVDSISCDNIAVLIRHGACVNEGSLTPMDRNRPFTPLQWAWKRSLVFCANLLISSGADYKVIPERVEGEVEHPGQDLIRAHIRVVQAREQRARLACCALWRVHRMPRDLRRVLMCAIWRERRNEAWDV